MMIDTDAHEAESLTEKSEDLYTQSDSADRDRFDENRGNNLGELDDHTIIWRFAQGKKRLVINQDLRIDYAHNSLQLSTPNGELIAIHKVAEKLHYILVKKDSKYSEMIQDIISECQFIPIDTATAERGFVRYQKYEIPVGYNLRYEPAASLWQTWQENQHQPIDGVQLDILILARLKWYRVQQMICTDDRLDLQTRLGLISLSLRDRIAWIAKLGDIPAVGNADLSAHQNGVNSGSDSDILGKIISKLAIEAAPGSLEAASVSNGIYFDANSTMSKSVFNQPHDSSLLYDLDRTSTLTGNIMSPISEQLRDDAIAVLEDYLANGETIVRTETIVDAQGNIMSEKTVSIHRGCPRWAIEAIVGWH
jgi:hypothetical protein